MTSDLPSTFEMNTPEPLQRRDISTNTEDEKVQPTDYRASSRTRLPPLDERKENDGKGDMNQPRPPLALTENQVSFEHQQYEQWARLPVRRPLVPLQNKMVSIQQPKPRPLTRSDKSDTSDAQVTKVKPHVVREKSVLSRLTTCLSLKREKTNLTERSFSKEKIFHKFKNPLALANATLLDLSDEEMISFKSLRDIKGTAEYQEFHQETRLRIGRAKLRDRCPMPVSVSSPRCVGEHVFFIHESCRSSDVPKLKKKKTNQNSDIFGSKEMEPNSKLDRESIPLLHFSRSKTHYSGLSPRKLPINRSAIKMSSAELFDFSKMEQFDSPLGSLQKSSDDRLAYKENKDFDLSMKGSQVVLYKSLLPTIKDSGG